MPELACPFRCVYCNQAAISGQDKLPQPAEIEAIINRNIRSFPAVDKHIDIAFFGGNFTGLPFNMQRSYLQIAHSFVKQGVVQGIRLSTRPDYIDNNTLDLLHSEGVTTIELGAQSLDDEVLNRCGRGHTAADVHRAAQLIRERGFRLGLQMMIGLPGDTREKSYKTARQIIELKADETRIYPCLVIRNTELEKLYNLGDYVPLNLDNAIEWSVHLWQMFETAGVKVIRLGLHPSDGLNGEELVAGPYHPSFKELVMTALWRKNLEKYTSWPEDEDIMIDVPAPELGAAVGHKAVNRKWLEKRYRKVVFKGVSGLSPHSFTINTLTRC